MTRLGLAALSALLFGMGYLGAVIWAFDQADGVNFYRLTPLSWHVLVLPICVAPMLPLVAGDFTHWLVTEVTAFGAWSRRLWPLIGVGLAFYFYDVVLQAPTWLIAVALIPFTLAFVFPGFAYPSANEVHKIDPDELTFAPTWLHWVGIGVMAVFVIAAWFPIEFFAWNARETSGIRIPGIVVAIALSGVLQILQNRNPRHMPFLPMFKLNETRWSVVGLRLFFMWLATMSFVIVFYGFAPYLFTKTMGEDLRQQGQIQSRRWEPDRSQCRGKVELLANTGQLFEICFDDEGALPGFAEGVAVDMVVRTSYVGFYITEMAVVDGS